MKVSELQGAELDYWVGKSLGFELRYADSVNMLIEGVRVTSPEYRAAWHVYDKNKHIGVIPTPDSGKFNSATIYSPSTDWSQGGPIIEREKIDTTCTHVWYALHNAAFTDERQMKEFSGPTPLIAAMRCFVASKYGDEVPEK